MSNVIAFPSTHVTTSSMAVPEASVCYLKWFNQNLARLKVRGWKVAYTERETLLWHAKCGNRHMSMIEAMDTQEDWDNGRVA